eukprot:m.171454 g.171454  ORF g.171454 m.171454 type:complete len:318 (+) comp24239_c0_seq2:1026-1979(+)
MASDDGAPRQTSAVGLLTAACASSLAAVGPGDGVGVDRGRSLDCPDSPEGRRSKGGAGGPTAEPSLSILSSLDAKDDRRAIEPKKPLTAREMPVLISLCVSVRCRTPRTRLASAINSDTGGGGMRTSTAPMLRWLSSSMSPAFTSSQSSSALRCSVTYAQHRSRRQSALSSSHGPGRFSSLPPVNASMQSHSCGFHSLPLLSAQYSRRSRTEYHRAAYTCGLSPHVWWTSLSTEGAARRTRRCNSDSLATSPPPPADGIELSTAVFRIPPSSTSDERASLSDTKPSRQGPHTIAENSQNVSASMLASMSDQSSTLWR